jgi:hypothetical protein
LPVDAIRLKIFTQMCGRPALPLALAAKWLMARLGSYNQRA